MLTVKYANIFKKLKSLAFRRNASQTPQSPETTKKHSQSSEITEITEIDVHFCSSSYLIA